MTLVLDIDRSLLRIGGRTFPAVGVVCPAGPDRLDETEWERRFSGGGGGTRVAPHRSYTVHVPTENGLLVEIEATTERPGTFEVALYARSCETTLCTADDGDYLMWVPIMVSLNGAELVSAQRPYTHGRWSRAEEDWVVELIDRVSAMAYTPPPGPQVALVPLARLLLLDDENNETEAP